MEPPPEGITTKAKAKSSPRGCSSQCSPLRRRRPRQQRAALEEEQIGVVADALLGWRHARVIVEAPASFLAIAAIRRVVALADGAAVVLDSDKTKQIKILLNGQNNGSMPAWKQLSDTDLAAVISYTKNNWSNKTGQLVQPAEVKAAR